VSGVGIVVLRTFCSGQVCPEVANSPSICDLVPMSSFLIRTHRIPR
jgi:hypothetical protein